jgi:hypothetical protein
MAAVTHKQFLIKNFELAIESYTNNSAAPINKDTPGHPKAF